MAEEASTEAAAVIKVKGSIVIPAPPSEVFAFMCDPYRMASSPNRVIDENTNLPGGLRRTRSHTVKADGSVVYREEERLKCIPDKQTVVRIRMMPFRKRGRVEWLNNNTFEPVGEGTRVTISQKYRVRPWYLARHARRKHEPARAQALGRSLVRLRAAFVSGSFPEPSAEAADPPPPSVVVNARRRPSRNRVGVSLAALAIAATVVVVTLAGVTSSANSPKAVAAAYLNAILGASPDGACYFVNPVHERKCEAYFAPAQKLTQLVPNLGAIGQAKAVNLVMHAHEAVVSMAVEFCLASTCEWTHDPNAGLPSSSLSFGRAYSNALSESPLLSHVVACVRISGKWYADMDPDGPTSPSL